MFFTDKHKIENKTNMYVTLITNPILAQNRQKKKITFKEY